ncbi:MAG: hypothetical protein ACWA5X_08995 [bacterium]
MKKRLFIFFLLVAAALMMLFSANNGKKHTMKVGELPWQVEAVGENKSKVFGIVLGETTLFEAMDHWKTQPDVGLFQSPDGKLRLEGYFGKMRLGVFDAYVIARLGATNEQMQRYFEVKITRKPMPSGDYKYELPEKELTEAHSIPISEITYVPSVAYTAELVEERFGPPTGKKTLGEGRSLWLYKDKNLALILDDKDKEILHYVTPARFDELAHRLASLKD